MSDEFLIRLFRRHFTDSVAALRRLDSHLATVELPFDLRAQLRELIFPPQPNLPDGLPSLIYYFVPNSKRGTDQPEKKDPRSFINSCDGIGLNLGCPVRLLRALDALIQLSVDDQREPKDGLRNASQHLSTVEELLWLTGWNSPTRLRRGGQFSGLKGNVDWALSAKGFPVFLEAKFRVSDWPRLSDGNFIVRQGEGFLSRAAHKFPDPPQTPALHIVGLTTFDNINEEIMHLIGHELEASPQIHAVVVRSILQMTHVISTSLKIRDRVLDLLAVPSITDFSVNNAIFYDRKQRDKRVSSRGNKRETISVSKAFCWSIEPKGKLSFPTPEPGLYRLDIPSRGSDGEPHFKIIPKYLMP
jgi:hypothetical protein